MKPSVVVVGAGVSGCACAATLATRGVGVLVLNGALDAVCLPSFGPELCVGENAVSRVVSALGRLPGVLCDAWLDCALVPEGACRFVTVDRRMLSVRAKKALEGIEGLEFRQGLVVDVRMRGSSGEAQAGGIGSSGFVVETAFGEVMEADHVILAPGLSMGGEVVVGEATLSGGRYGETPSTGLRGALTRLGAEWREVREAVGPRYVAREGRLGVGETVVAAQPGGVLSLREVRLVGRRGIGLRDAVGVRGTWGRDEAARTRDLRGVERSRPGRSAVGEWAERGWPPVPGVSAAVARRGGFVEWFCGEGGDARSGAYSFPDGLAMDEVAVLGEPGLVGGTALHDSLEFGETPSRARQEIKGLQVANLDIDGRLRLKVGGESSVWVVGRAAGAKSYLESIESGVSGAERVLAELWRAGEE